jgi:hypothetical protein
MDEAPSIAASYLEKNFMPFIFTQMSSSQGSKAFQLPLLLDHYQLFK